MIGNQMTSPFNTGTGDGKVMPIDTALTMSSREVAELTSKRHLHILRDVRKMLQTLGGDETKFGSIYLDDMNREQTEFLLPKRECLILVSGYSTELRAKIIDRWLELEAAIGNAAPDLGFIDFADRARADNEAVRDLVTGEARNTRGAVIKAIKEFAGSPLTTLKQYLDDRFMASRERDKMMIGSMAALSRQQQSLDRSVGQVLDMARRSIEPDAFVARDWVAVGSIYALAGMQGQIPRQKSLSARLHVSLDAFCIQTGRQMDLRSIDIVRPTRVWRAEAVRAWLKDRGRSMIDQHLAKHSSQTVIQFPGKADGEGK